MKKAFIVALAAILTTLCLIVPAFPEAKVRWSAPMNEYPNPWVPTAAPPRQNPWQWYPYAAYGYSPYGGYPGQAGYYPGGYWHGYSAPYGYQGWYPNPYGYGNQ